MVDIRITFSRFEKRIAYRELTPKEQSRWRYLHDICEQRSYPPMTRYIGVYVVTRHFGGPEEGGWWYNWYEHVASVICDHSSESRRRRRLVEVQEQYAWMRTGNIYSVHGGQEIEILLEDSPGANASTETPHYE